MNFLFLRVIGPQPPFRQNRQKIAAIVENFLLDICRMCAIIIIVKERKRGKEKNDHQPNRIRKEW